MHEYDSYGRLVRTVSDGEPAVEFTYDELGNLASMTRSVNAGTEGISAPAAEWRRTRSETSYIVDGGNVWISTTNVNLCSDASIAPLVTAVESQLTGLSAASPECSRSVDVHGNATVNTRSVAVPDVVAIQTVPYVTNSSLSILRYGVELRTVSVSCVSNTFAYDHLGRKVAATDGRGNTSRNEYNSLGQTSATIDALGNRTEYAYDQFGNLASVTDPLGNAKFYEYDLRGRKSYEGGATYPVRYTYDVFGNLSTLSTTRDPAANLSTFQPFNFSTVSWDTTALLYDEASGAITNKIYADGKGPTYDYTPEGRLSRRTWARGILTEYAYDSWGNLTNTVYSDETPTISIAYDAMGRMVSALVDGVSTNLYFHSAYGDLTNEVQNGASIARSYDCFGRPTGYALNPGNPDNPVEEVSYSYDAFGRFSAVVAGTNVFEYTRLPGSDLVSGYTSGPFRRAVSYEPQRDLIAAVTNAFGPTLISAFDYANDAAGRRVSRIDTFDGAATTNTFGYNIRSEVTSAAMGTNRYSYAYDPIGNRLFSSHNAETNAYTANSLNQYTAISNLCASVSPCEEMLTYDADGNMTADGSGWHYAWNGENRMVCASNDDVLVTYEYDHRGRMVRKEISSRDTETQSFAYVWDDWNILRETLTTKVCSSVSDNIWGLDINGAFQGAGGIGGLLAVIRDDGVFLPAYDANGNVTEYIATNGPIVAHYEYSAFGEPVASSSRSATSFTCQFSTKPYFATTELSEYQMRKYRHHAGRWMSRDSIDDPLVINDVVAVNNNFIDNLDYIGNFQLSKISECLVKCGIGSTVDDLFDDFFAGNAFCGDLKRECEENFVDYISGTTSSPFPSLDLLSPPSFGRSKKKRIANCLFKCLKLDAVGLSISSDVEFLNSKNAANVFSCNKSDKQVTYRLTVSMKLFIEPGHNMIFKKQSRIMGSCGSVTFQKCCPCENN